MDCIFVTGGTGLLGCNVILELLNRGHRVKALVREIATPIEHENLEFFSGDITKKETLKLAMQSCNAVIHIAATTNQALKKYSDYKKINTFGTINVFEVAQESGIKKFIYISSSNTIGNGTEKEWANELNPINYPFSESFYAKSKKEAETFLLSNLNNMHVVILNPTFMLGYYDIKPSSGRLVLAAYKKPIMFVPKGGKNFVYVKDAAVAVCNALTAGRNGERYLLGNKNMNFKEFYKIQKTVVHHKQILLILPTFLLLLVGLCGNLLQFMGIRTSITKRNLQQLCVQEYYSPQKAIDELNLPQTPINTAIQSAIEWFDLIKKVHKK